VGELPTAEGEENKKENSGLALGPDTEEMLREVRMAVPGEIGVGELAEGQEDPASQLDAEDYLLDLAKNAAEINKGLKELNMLFRRFLKNYRRANNLLGPENQTIQGTSKGIIRERAEEKQQEREKEEEKEENNKKIGS
jgi:hypothetical protein